jgi:hypothetical protein
MCSNDRSPVLRLVVVGEKELVGVEVLFGRLLEVFQAGRLFRILFCLRTSSAPIPWSRAILASCRS